MKRFELIFVARTIWLANLDQFEGSHRAGSHREAKVVVEAEVGHMRVGPNQVGGIEVAGCGRQGGRRGGRWSQRGEPAETDLGVYEVGVVVLAQHLVLGRLFDRRAHQEVTKLEGDLLLSLVRRDCRVREKSISAQVVGWAECGQVKGLSELNSEKGAFLLVYLHSREIILLPVKRTVSSVRSWTWRCKRWAHPGGGGGGGAASPAPAASPRPAAATGGC